MSKLAKEVMQTIYIAETRDRIKISDDRDATHPALLGGWWIY